MMGARVKNESSHVADIVETRSLSAEKMGVADSFGYRMARVIEAGVSVRHGPRVPVLNRVLAVTNRIDALPFLALTLAAFLTCAAILAGALYAGECWCVGRRCRGARFWRLVVVAFRQLAVGSDAEYLGDRGAAGAPARCAALASCGDFAALVLQSVVLGIVAAKFTAPMRNRLVFSDKLVEFQRDGSRCLSFRVAHPLGHLLAAFSVTMLWVKPHLTAEGEKRMAFLPLEVAPHRAELDVPLEIAHRVDENSPLYDASTEGFVAVTVGGYDTVLTTEIVGCHWYKLAHVEHARGRVWHSVVTRSKATAAKEGGRAAVDLGHLDALTAN